MAIEHTRYLLSLFKQSGAPISSPLYIDSVSDILNEPWFCPKVLQTEEKATKRLSVIVVLTCQIAAWTRCHNFVDCVYLRHYNVYLCSLWHRSGTRLFSCFSLFLLVRFKGQIYASAEERLETRLPTRHCLYSWCNSIIVAYQYVVMYIQCHTFTNTCES